MKKPILIVRTVSVEKISEALDLCLEKWPGHPLIVATTANRSKELANDNRIDRLEIVDTGPRGYDRIFHLEEHLEAVVFPIGNKNGSGYGNVFRAFSSLCARNFYMSPYCRDFRSMGRLRLKLKYGTELALEELLSVFGRIWAQRLIRGIDL